ncbi:MAG TPA: bifunctional tRNA (5-methylaminomethyl-2-thiouridine)(34)-methyltransferase MnmD/FAD-dependent 5-carboxymethylaminomethyl-2-thiouridine(34) oxidoreductase MnmC, partial [Pantoea sp.]|nr:bifunctional tRNA (5-methylaminomethyl-2-thiouridine)(34)-methyltransferase MnmD/FAD-dependent 5-carboxymethylaminomethyl-2-thiouridine(34) oxidoreductase MnmC [Pantoea sp.]
PELPVAQPWFARPAAREKETAIIGGGVASAVLALALLRRGWRVTLYCADEAAALGASGNRQGALYPLLNQHDPALARFFPAAFSFARRIYDAAPVSYEHCWSGVLQLGRDEKSADKIAQMLAMALPEVIARGVTPEEAEALAQVDLGVGGVFYPLGGWLSPAELTAALLAHGETQGLRIHWLHRLTQLSPADQGWTLRFADGKTAMHHNVTLATGHALSALPQSAQLPTYAVSGQVSHVPSTPGLDALQTVLCYDGYLTPVSPQFGTHCIGASYHRGDTSTAYREEDQQQNRTRLLHSLPGRRWAENVEVSARDARIGVRCATRDHLPMAGALPDYEATLARYQD